ncbi:MAG: alanyl-tRNA editing protein [Sulfitobacter sp.]|uniref:alanyl-tRNA editing protein n=1 Tax=Sulfitobacter sp. TaxID=1903071 RepID=UPI00405955D7
MTEALYLEDAYLRDAPARVRHVTAEGGIVLDRTIFYPTGGGQPGDSGWLSWDGRRMPIATTVKGDDDSIVLVPAEPQQIPQTGTHLIQSLDWDRRHRHMRVHTLLHLLSVAVPFGVTGGQVSVNHGRLDFDMPDAPDDREGIENALSEFITADLRVSSEWITQDELRAAPDLVKTMAVAPPKGAERVRLVQIGDMESRIDLQPCGGTHVARTGEIGSIQLGKVEKKGRHNRRVYVHLDG